MNLVGITIIRVIVHVYIK